MPTRAKVYPLRWVFSWSSSKAELDARQRHKACAAGEQAIQRVKGLLGKYDYKSRKIIESRAGEGLAHKAQASRYFSCTLHGSDEDQAWELHGNAAPRLSARRNALMASCCSTPPCQSSVCLPAP